jgi:hypothetical protein
VTEGPAHGPGGPRGAGGPGGEDLSVGTLGEEATKLLQALQGWAKEGGAQYAGAGASAAEGLSSAWEQVNEHLATGGDDCRYCPVCQVISAVRRTPPDVREHLVTAATSLMQAAAGLLATDVPAPGRRHGQDPVERIDLDEGDRPGDQDDREWEDDQ